MADEHKPETKIDQQKPETKANEHTKAKGAGLLAGAALLGGATEEFSREAINSREPGYHSQWGTTDELHVGGDRLGRDGALAVDAVRIAAVDTGRAIDRATQVVIHHPEHAAVDVGNAFETAFDHTRHGIDVAAVNTGDAIKKAAKVTWDHPGQAADDVGRAFKDAGVDIKNAGVAVGHDITALSHDPAAMAVAAAGTVLTAGAAALGVHTLRRNGSGEPSIPEGYDPVAEAEKATKEAASGHATIDSSKATVGATDKRGIAERLKGLTKAADKATDKEAGIPTGNSRS